MLLNGKPVRSDEMKHQVVSHMIEAREKGKNQKEKKKLGLFSKFLCLLLAFLIWLLVSQIGDISQSVENVTDGSDVSVEAQA